MGLWKIITWYTYAQYDVLLLCFINGSLLYLIGVYLSNYTLLSTWTKKAIHCVKIWLFYNSLLWNVPLEGKLINGNNQKVHTSFTIVTRFFENGRKRQSLNKWSKERWYHKFAVGWPFCHAKSKSLPYPLWRYKNSTTFKGYCHQYVPLNAF